MSETQNAAEVQTEDQGAGPELTIQDLMSLKTIIDVASQRGSFKPNEMAAVGNTYTKLETFLNAIAAQQQQAQGEAVPEGE